MNIGKIYIVKNKENEVCYVGQTIQPLNQRWNKHLSDARNETDKDNKFHKKLREEGFENFSIEIIEDNIEQIELDSKEIYWIDYYDTFYNGLNSTKGGSGIVNLGTSKKIYQIDINTNKIIKSFNSAANAARELNIDPASIRDCARGRNLSSAGFRWAYEDNLSDMLNSQLTDKDKAQKGVGVTKHCNSKIYRIDLKTNLVTKVYASLKEAAEDNNISKSSITGCINEKDRKTAGGYRWAYDDKLQYMLEHPLSEEDINNALNKGKKKIEQYDLKTGKTIAIFESAADAARELNINNVGIGKACRGDRKSYLGFGWRYI